MKQRLPLLLALLGLLLVGSGLAYGALERAVASPGPAPLPRSVAGLGLAEELAGPEAVGNIARLHRQAFPLSAAAVGTYRDGTHSATLWVSESPLSPLARQMEQAMEQAIATTPTPFVPEESRRVDGRLVHVLGGMGQRHYYFRSGNLVVWLAIDRPLAVDQPLAGAALTDALAFYR